MMLPDNDLESGKEVAERIRTSVETLTWKAEGFSVTLSIGVAAYNSSEDNDPLKEADRRQFRAQTRGTNRIDSEP